MSGSNVRRVATDNFTAALPDAIGITIGNAAAGRFGAGAALRQAQESIVSLPTASTSSTLRA